MILLKFDLVKLSSLVDSYWIYIMDISLYFSGSLMYQNVFVFAFRTTLGSFLPFFFLKCIYLFWERQRQCEQGSGREREGDRESKEGLAPATQTPVWGLNSRTVRSWPKPKSVVGCSTDWAIQVPQDLPPLILCKNLPF